MLPQLWRHRRLEEAKQHIHSAVAKLKLLRHSVVAKLKPLHLLEVAVRLRALHSAPLPGEVFSGEAVEVVASEH